MSTKELGYNGCKNVLCRVAYKLIKSGKTYKHSDSITINGKKKSYKDIIALIKKNGTNYGHDEYISRFMEDVIAKTAKENLPGYVMGSSGVNKYNRASYRKIAKEITAYRNIYNKNPSKLTVTYEKITIFKKYGRSKEYGCDNRGQNNGYYCGPHMVQEVIRNLTGKVIKQSTLAAVIGTTTSGSDHQGLNTAFAWFNKKYNYNLTVEWKNFSDVGWNGIEKILESKNQDCGLHELYRDTWGHYTNYDKVYDNTVDVHNSLGDKCGSSCYCGYTENRNKGDAKRYLSGISQKSVLIVTRK